MKLGILFSGGKDSVYAIDWAIKQGHEVCCLITMLSKNPESYMFHFPNIKWTKLQAEAIEIPIILEHTDGIKEEELKDLKKAIEKAKKDYNIEGIVSGAIFSKYQKERIDNIANELEIQSFSPFWDRSPKTLLIEMVSKGYKVIISSVAAHGLTEDWLGKEFTPELIEKLSHLHNTCYVCTAGEGGEFETLTIDGPIFKKKIKIIDSEIKWDSKTQSGELIITNAELA